MNLTIAELNELVYCIGRTIADDPKGWNIEKRQELYNKLYSELEERLKHLAQPNFWSTDDNFDHLRDYEPDELDN